MFCVSRFLALLTIVVTFCVQGFAFDVCFISLHPGPARHFAALTKVLDESKVSWQILAGDEAETIFKSYQIPHRRLNVWAGKNGLKGLSVDQQGSIAKLIAKECKKDKMIITDISESIIAQIHHELSRVSLAKRYVYYDNPEAYVTKEYSKALELVLDTKLDGIVFASYQLPFQNLLKDRSTALDVREIEKVGLGIFPAVEEAKTLDVRDHQGKMRDKLFQKLGIVDEKQKILLYLGGASTSYFEEGFPFFLHALEESVSEPFFENVLLLLQQHPRAKEESLDLYELLAKAFPFQVFSSPLPIFDAIASSDVTYYYKTSMAPYFVLAGYPVVQVSPTALDDLGVRLGMIPSVRSPAQLSTASLKALSEAPSSSSLRDFAEKLGYHAKWPDHFMKFVREHL